MPPLPRGTCPICGQNVALRKGDLVREHRKPVPVRVHRFRDPFVRPSEMPICDGSGQRVVPA